MNEFQCLFVLVYRANRAQAILLSLNLTFDTPAMKYLASYLDHADLENPRGGLYAKCQAALQTYYDGLPKTEDKDRLVSSTVYEAVCWLEGKNDKNIPVPGWEA